LNNVKPVVMRVNDEQTKTYENRLSTKAISKKTKNQRRDKEKEGVEEKG